MANFQIRVATAGDAKSACEAIQASIRQSCLIDHQGDPDVLANWLRNKTPENIGIWLSEPTSHALVAVAGKTILGLTLINVRGVITLFYVRPSYQRRGVGRKLLMEIEAHARAIGIHHLRLDSTATAFPFYSRLGYKTAGPSVNYSGIESFPMMRALH